MGILNLFNSKMQEAFDLLKCMTSDERTAALHTWNESLLLIQQSVPNNSLLPVDPQTVLQPADDLQSDHDILAKCHKDADSTTEILCEFSEVEVLYDASDEGSERNDLNHVTVELGASPTQISAKQIVIQSSHEDQRQPMKNSLSHKEFTNAMKSLEVKIVSIPIEGATIDHKMCAAPTAALDESYEDKCIVKVEKENSSNDSLLMAGSDIRKPKRKYRKSGLSKEERFKCSDCGKLLSNSSNLKVHMRVHSGAHPHLCSICNKAFSIRPNMLRHERKHAGLKPWQCSLCNKCFTEKKSLTVHCRTHTGEKPFKCEYCDRQFTQAGTLQSHIHVHTGWKGHLCDLCGKAFRQKSQLLLHRLRHVNSRPHKCSECTRSFITKGELTRHGLLHTGERPYLCSLCPKRFTRLSYLKDHVNQHTGERPYRCGRCPAAFPDRSAYCKHVRQHTAGGAPCREAGAAQRAGETFLVYFDTDAQGRELVGTLVQDGLGVDGAQPVVLVDGEICVHASQPAAKLAVNVDTYNEAVDMKKETELATQSIADSCCLQTCGKPSCATDTSVVSEMLVNVHQDS